MTDIKITKLAGDCTDNTLQSCSETSGGLWTWNQTYLFKTGDYILITNYEQISFELDLSASDFPIPELRDFQNIIVKAEGNRMVINMSWTIKDEDTTIVTSTPSQQVKTVQQQLDFFVNTFQPNSISDVYKIEIDGIERAGTIRKMTFTKQASTPITYSASMEFVAGDVVAGE